MQQAETSRRFLRRLVLQARLESELFEFPTGPFSGAVVRLRPGEIDKAEEAALLGGCCCIRRDDILGPDVAVPDAVNGVQVDKFAVNVGAAQKEGLVSRTRMQKLETTTKRTARSKTILPTR